MAGRGPIVRARWHMLILAALTALAALAAMSIWGGMAQAQSQAQSQAQNQAQNQAQDNTGLVLEPEREFIDLSRGLVWLAQEDAGRVFASAGGAAELLIADWPAWGTLTLSNPTAVPMERILRLEHPTLAGRGLKAGTASQIRFGPGLIAMPPGADETGTAPAENEAVDEVPGGEAQGQAAMPARIIDSAPAFGNGVLYRVIIPAESRVDVAVAASAPAGPLVAGLWAPARFEQVNSLRRLVEGLLLGSLAVLLIFAVAYAWALGNGLMGRAAGLGGGALLFALSFFGYDKLFAGGLAAGGLLSTLAIVLLAILLLEIAHNLFAPAERRITGWGLRGAQVLMVGAAAASFFGAPALGPAALAAPLICLGLAVFKADPEREGSLRTLPGFALIALGAAAAAGIALSDLSQQAVMGELAAVGLIVLGVLGLTTATLMVAPPQGADVLPAGQGLLPDTEPAPVALPAPPLKLAVDPEEQNELVRYRVALRSAYEGLWDWTVGTDDLATSDVVDLLLGLQPGTLNGSEARFRAHMHADDIPTYQEALNRFGAEPGLAFDLGFRMYGRSGEVRWFEMRASSVPGDKAGEVRIVGVISDVTARKEVDIQREEDGKREPVLGTWTEPSLRDALSEALDAYRDGSGPRPAVYAIAVPRIAAVAEGLADSAADQLRTALVKRLENMARDEDMVCWPGGETFLLYRADGGELTDARDFGHQIAKRLDEAVTVKGQQVFPNPRIGVVTGASGEASTGTVISQALAAMGRADATERVQLHRPAHAQDAAERLKLEADLRQALERGEIDLLYQPIMSLRSGSIAGFEALMRWRRNAGPLMEPKHFLKTAEELGLAPELGNYVLRKAIGQLRAWRTAAPGMPLFLSVNISSQELMHPEFLKRLRGAMAGADLPPRALYLEVTERLILDNPDKAKSVIDEIRKLKIGVALDDFGTGFSALSYLRQFTFDHLKIDRTFVSALQEKGPSSTIVKSIISLAHNLRQEVVAEGAESEADVKVLRAMGCEYAQGYLFGAPLSAGKAESFLKQISEAAKAKALAAKPAPKPADPAKPAAASVAPSTAVSAAGSAPNPVSGPAGPSAGQGGPYAPSSAGKGSGADDTADDGGELILGAESVDDPDAEDDKPTRAWGGE